MIAFLHSLKAEGRPEKQWLLVAEVKVGRGKEGGYESQIWSKYILPSAVFRKP